MICILFFCVSCTMTPDQLFSERIEVAKEYFDIDFDDPKLYWLKEDTYKGIVKSNSRLKDKAGFIFGDRIFIISVFRDDPFLEYYFDHELGHFIVSQLSKRDQSEYFADMYATVQEYK